ncbi:DNA replication factor Cdt1 [Orussus abietinus]|uniref:DNA replication factor Cdt1 n=1 Tax=Orussus abietinus TaxID=222816 RepID=UPI00062628DE|nr:DNA replication factor Cdt1 [Orussus abietinus]
MSQPSVAEFFNTRKRHANDDLLRSKSKVIILDDEHETITRHNLDAPATDISATKVNSRLIYPVSRETTVHPVDEEGQVKPKSKGVVRNIQFDSPKSSIQQTSKTMSRARVTRSRKLSVQEGQMDIRDTFLKISSESKNVPFEKKGILSPIKKGVVTPKKDECLLRPTSSITYTSEKESNVTSEPSAVGSVTPKKNSCMIKLAKQDMSLDEIETKIKKSSKLKELRESIARIKKCEENLAQFQKKTAPKNVQIQKFNKIQLEIPVSPQKVHQSLSKIFLSPVKNVELPKTASPERRLLFAPKEPSPVKVSPTKTPAYQKYQSLVDSGIPALPLPYNYRFLAEVFRCIDTVSAMLYNRKEIITFKKLKPAVQELVRRNFTLEHLAQIKSIYPEAFQYHQEKVHVFGSMPTQDKYELILTPLVTNSNNESNMTDANELLKSHEMMSPSILLERRRKFYKILLDMVKDQHEKFLLNLQPPMIIPKERITRWHPEFDVNTCEIIKPSELPLPPNINKASSVRDVLDKAKSLFHCNTRIEKALQRLAETKMSSNFGASSVVLSTVLTKDATDQVESSNKHCKVEISIVDTPPATPSSHSNYLSSAFKGIPTALLEKVRAKQAAKALETMTRSSSADKEAMLYSRLPELAKVLRNIFVVEKKSVLTMESVIQKLDNSFRVKLTPNEMEEHINLLCKLLPTWLNIHKVRKVDYLKLAKDVDMGKVIKRLQFTANEKVNGS